MCFTNGSCSKIQHNSMQWRCTWPWSTINPTIDSTKHYHKYHNILTPFNQWREGWKNIRYTCVSVCVNSRTKCASPFRVKVTNTVYFGIFDANLLWYVQIFKLVLNTVTISQGWHCVRQHFSCSCENYVIFWTLIIS